MSERSEVPCNGCTACCRGDLIILHPEHGDQPADYLTEEVTNPLTGKSAIALRKAGNGNCIYLGDAGCTIHDRAPKICRTFDCRRWYLLLGRNLRRQMRKAGGHTPGILAAGRARLKTLDTNGRR